MPATIQHANANAKQSKQSAKRILSVTVKRMCDTDPDTSWLGKYSDRRLSEYDIDRAHGIDCDTLRHDAEESKHIKECEYVGNDAWDCGHIDNSDSDEQCDCHVCVIPTTCDCIGDNWNRREYRYFNGNVENYEGESAEDIRKYVRQDYARMEGLNNSQWGFIGIRADARVILNTAVDPTLTQDITSGGLWGIESDIGKGYLESVEQEQLAELRGQLSELGFSSRAISKAFETAESKDE
jgi:hypothetical protein